MRSNVLFLSVIIIILLSDVPLVAQQSLVNKEKSDFKKVEPLFLIPFNDHGKWGWSDTLGNVLIKPRFKATGFFYLTDNGKNKEFRSIVTTKFGSNYYVYNAGMLLPERVNTLYKLRFPDFKSGEHYLVENRKHKIGLYDAGKKAFAFPMKYDSVYFDRSNHEFILVRNKNDSTYKKYDLKKNEISPTNIVSIHERILINGELLIIVVHKDGNYSELKKGVLNPIDLDRLVNLKSDPYEDLEVTVDDGEGSTERVFEVRKSDGLQSVSYFFGNLKSPDSVFSLTVIQEGKKLGVVGSREEIILPYIYDKLIFNSRSTQVKLFKDGKQGIKLFFTHYPTIEAKYDMLYEATRLRITKKWVFTIFRVTIGGEQGYVGENGVEYFDFK